MKLPSSNTLVQAGVDAWMAGNRAEAAELYQRAIDADPDNAAALAMLGHARIHEKDFAAAEMLLERAIALDPRLAEAHINLVVMLHAQKRHDEVIRCCDRGLQSVRGNRTLLHIQAVSLGESGRHREALAVVAKLIARARRDAPLRYFAAALHHKLGEPAKALSSLLLAAEFDTSEPMYQVAAGEALLSAGRAAEALAHLETALRLRAGDARALELRTRALSALGMDA